MDTPELAAIRQLEQQVQAMAWHLRDLGYEGELPVDIPSLPDLRDFIQEISESQSKFAKRARDLLDKL